MQGFRHVIVPQIPGRISFVEHRAVVLLRVLYKSSILFRKKEGVPGNLAITSGKITCAPVHFHPLADDLIFAALVEAEASSVPVRLGVFAKIIEAGVTTSGSAGSLRIDFVQEIQHSSNRGEQAV